MEQQAPVDPVRERHRMKAAASAMERRQRLAMSGAVVAAAGVWAGNAYPELPDLVCTALQWGGPLIGLAMAVPFLRSECPQCKGRYHSLASLGHHPAKPLPCKSCGFAIDKPRTMY